MADKPKPKLSDAERHARFKDMAREVEASKDARDFDEAFETITASQPIRRSNH